MWIFVGGTAINTLIFDARDQKFEALFGTHPGSGLSNRTASKLELPTRRDSLYYPST